MLIAIAQINLLVGHISSNKTRIIEYIRSARDKHHASLVIFPELALTSYPPEDLLLRPSLFRQVESALEDISREAEGIEVIISYPLKENDCLYNSCSLITNSTITATYHKKVLPNYGVFDEKRYFQPGHDMCRIDLDGISTALSICEDLWTPDHARCAVDGGARLLINLNASPFHAEKQVAREELLRQRVRETGLTIIYVNLVGGQDELVFDGGSMVINSRTEIVFRAPRFKEGLFLFDCNLAEETLYIRPQLPQQPALTNHACIYQALVLGVRDYADKNGFQGAVIGLSGGIDSALTLSIAVDALGIENVEVLLMPSRYTADMSVDDAKTMAETLGIHYHIIPIEKPVTVFTELLAPLFAGLPTDVTEENIQARCRGLLLMALSNKTGKLVLATGNKSEMAVGYATLYGDMAGGFAPLKDVSKTLVYELSDWRNSRGQIIPQRIIDRPPSAELRPDQKDEDSLPPYADLDPVLERYIEQDQSPEEIIKQGFDRDMVYEVTRLVDRNEYKRRQAAPGVKITKRAFGRDRRYPITSGYREK